MPQCSRRPASARDSTHMGLDKVDRTPKRRALDPANCPGYLHDYGAPLISHQSLVTLSTAHDQPDPSSYAQTQYTSPGDPPPPSLEPYLRRRRALKSNYQSNQELTLLTSHQLEFRNEVERV